MSGLFHELKRRNVFKVGAAYVVLAWLVSQAADLASDTFGAPDWVMKMLVTLLALALPFVLFFAWAYELTPEGLKREKDVDRSQSITHQTGRKLDFVIIGILLAALGYFAVDKFYLAPAQHAERQAAAEVAASAGTKSIAVLPFVNMSEDRGNEYFSDGISEEILNALAKVPELQVAGRTSSFAFKGENQDLRAIGKTLGVEHILEGSVRKAGMKVRITAQLIRVDNGFHLWSDSYDRQLDDVFAIQDEIANAILQQLKAHLVDGETPVVAAQRTNSEAYDLYLLARQRMYERKRLALEDAAQLLDRAIAIDPAYAPAHAQRAIVINLLGENQYGTIPRADMLASAKPHIDEALRLDPDLAEGWAALGLWYQDQPGKDAEGITALEKAQSLNPGLIDAANWLHLAYLRTGQPAKALPILLDIRRRDPLYRPAIGNLAFLYTGLGRPDSVRELAESVRPHLGQDADMLWLDSFMLASAGEFAEALPLSEAALLQESQDRVFRTNLGLALLQTHQYERAVEEGYWFTQAEALQRLGRVEEATQLATRRAADGEIAPLFRLLNRTRNSARLIEYLEARWPDLDSFATAFPIDGYFGYEVMNDVALAYRRAGDEAKSGDAMRRVRAAHDALAAQGISNPEFFINEAVWHVLAGDTDKALQFLGRAVDGGRVYTARISDEYPAFAELEGVPEYEAIRARMIEHLNRERAQLGLEPVSA